jgi:hypothetical protein
MVMDQIEKDQKKNKKKGWNVEPIDRAKSLNNGNRVEYPNVNVFIVCVILKSNAVIVGG